MNKKDTTWIHDIRFTIKNDIPTLFLTYDTHSNQVPRRASIVVYSKRTGWKLGTRPIISDAPFIQSWRQIEKGKTPVYDEIKAFVFPEAKLESELFLEIRVPKYVFMSRAIYRIQLSIPRHINPQVASVDSTQPSSSRLIPKIGQERVPSIPDNVWTYWHDESKLPSLVHECIQNWIRYNPKREIHLITRDTIRKYISRPIPDNFNRLSYQYQADWIRYAVIYEQGGIWLDASTLLTTSLDWVVDIQQERQVEHVFYFMKNQHAAGMHTIENWFLACLPRTDFMLKWLHEWEFIIEHFRGSGLQYVRYLLSKHGLAGTVRAEGFLNKIYKIGLIDYLSGYIAARKIMLVDGLIPSAAYVDADIGALRLSKECSWMSWCFLRKMVLQPAPDDTPRLIKMIHSQRLAIIKHLLHKPGDFHPKSILAQFTHIFS